MIDVKAAAERLSNAPEDYTATQQNLDMWTVVVAYLDEHPADDDEPVTGYWLLSVGFTPFGEAMMWSYRLGEVVVMGVSPETLADGNWGYNGKRLPRKKTRGDVRRLCEALGIELKCATEALR